MKVQQHVRCVVVLRFPPVRCRTVLVLCNSREYSGYYLPVRGLQCTIPSEPATTVESAGRRSIWTIPSHASIQCKIEPSQLSLQTPQSSEDSVGSLGLDQYPRIPARFAQNIVALPAIQFPGMSREAHREITGYSTALKLCTVHSEYLSLEMTMTMYLR